MHYTNISKTTKWVKRAPEGATCFDGRIVEKAEIERQVCQCIDVFLPKKAAKKIHKIRCRRFSARRCWGRLPHTSTDKEPLPAWRFWSYFHTFSWLWSSQHLRSSPIAWEEPFIFKMSGFFQTFRSVSRGIGSDRRFPSFSPLGLLVEAAVAPVLLKCSLFLSDYPSLNEVSGSSRLHGSSWISRGIMSLHSISLTECQDDSVCCSFIFSFVVFSLLNILNTSYNYP